MSQAIFLKWSPSVKDQFYEKSKPKDKHISIGHNVMETILQEGPSFIDNDTVREIGYSAIDTSLGQGSGIGTKRESNFERMNQRELIAQTNMNPFLSSNYLEDLRVQEAFLTPQNSNSQQNSYYSNE